MTVISIVRWDIDGWVTFEKSVRHQHEACVLGRHHRVVLYADIVGESETVPNRHIGVAD